MNKKRKSHFTLYLVISIILLVILFITACIVGKYSISIKEFFRCVFSSDETLATQRSIIFNLRLPRTLMAIFVGASLSVSGLLYQEIFQNKLTSPDLLGVSTGASVGAALAIILGLSSVFITIFAFGIGVGTVFLTIIISKLFKNGNSQTLILAGIIVGGFMSSILSLLKYFADPTTTLATITYWLMGSFANAKYTEVLVISIISIICFIVLIVSSFKINVVGLGEDEAKTKGINYKFYKFLLIGISTLLTACAVSFCGTISWIGLVIPHIVRLLIRGRDTRKTIPLSITFGACFMVVIDIVSRVFTTSEVPLSAVSGFFGLIIFVLICVKNRKEVVND